MVFPKARAYVALALFVGWLSFLGFLMLQTRDQIIPAGPQLQAANLLVVADLAEDRGRPAAAIKVQKVLYTQNKAWQQLAGQSLEIEELAFFSEKAGYQGAGAYVVPITRKIMGQITIDQVTPLPITPGYYPARAEVTIDLGVNPARVAKKVSEFTGTPIERLKEIFNVPVVVLANVPIRGDAEVQAFKKLIFDAGGNVGSVRPSEARIYLATPGLLAEVGQIPR